MATPQRESLLRRGLTVCLYQLAVTNFLLLCTVNSRYEPAPRYAHQTIRVGSNVYMWAGDVDDMPEVHDSQEKRRFISCVEVFLCETGDWIHQPTSGAPPLGVCGYGCTAVSSWFTLALPL